MHERGRVPAYAERQRHTVSAGERVACRHDATSDIPMESTARRVDRHALVEREAHVRIHHEDRRVPHESQEGGIRIQVWELEDRSHIRLSRSVPSAVFHHNMPLTHMLLLHTPEGDALTSWWERSLVKYLPRHFRPRGPSRRHARYGAADSAMLLYAHLVRHGSVGLLHQS